MQVKKSLRPASSTGALSAIAALTIAFLFAGYPARGQQTQNPNPPAKRGIASFFSQPDPIDFDNHTGWTQIFNGKNLDGWDGAPDIWHVEDGAIVGVSTPEHPSGTTNIIWRGGEPANFELKLEMKLEGAGANGGIQYRSSNVTTAPQMDPERMAHLTDAQKKKVQEMIARSQKYAKWGMKGYQADFDYSNHFTGQLYEQGTPRGIVAWRGQMVQTNQGQKPRLLATLGSSDELKAYIKTGQWNQYEVIADGNTMIHIINGHVMAILLDTDPTYSRTKGLIGFEIEGPGNVKVYQRNIWLKQLP